jgi:hypothetical protein
MDTQSGIKYLASGMFVDIPSGVWGKIHLECSKAAYPLMAMLHSIRLIAKDAGLSDAARVAGLFQRIPKDTWPTTTRQREGGDEDIDGSPQDKVIHVALPRSFVLEVNLFGVDT